MAADEKWYFTEEQLANTPSRKCGIDASKELRYRQQAANFIQDMGQRLAVTQLCINTAIVYMHRFYVFHSLSQFHRNSIATAALFLAAKVEEQPRKLEHVIKVAFICLNKDHQQPPDVRSEQYLEQVQDVVFNENVLLQTLGFDVAIDHPHTHVVRCCHLVKASKDLAQASYFMASNSLHLTTMCLQYKPTVVACFCIHLACKWSDWEIPQSNEGKHWFWYVDRSVTAEQLEQLTSEFLHIFDRCPSRLKRRIKSESAKQSPSLNHPSLTNSQFDYDPRQVNSPNDSGPTFQTRPFPTEEPKKPPVQTSSSSSASSRPPVDYREYREKKERERLEREKAAGVTNATGTPAENIVKSHHSHSHHAKQQAAQSSSVSSKHPGGPGAKLVSHHNHHGPHRNDGKPQQVSQRHSSSISASSQSVRPRLPRDYNAPATSGNAPYQHSHQTKENSTMAPSPLDPAGISDISALDPPTSDPNHLIAEKPTNHNRLEAKHEKSTNRGYDPRHKIPEHSVKDTEAKMYAKYQQEQLQQQQRGRKIVDSVEQRSEEVRKLIEKPLPPPKATLRTEITSQKDDFPANMLKQPHNTKYGQGEKMLPTATPSGGSSKNSQDFGVTAKIGITGKNSQHSLGGSKYENKSVKNGNSVVNEEIKTDKRPRHQLDDDRLQGTIINQHQQQQQQQSSIQHGMPPQTVKQHKSLFSPEKASNSREFHTRISRSSRQKTPPSTGNLTNLASTGIPKSSKVNERVPDQANYDHTGQFEGSVIGQTVVNHQNLPHHHSQAQNLQETPRPTSHSKRHRTSSIGDSSRQSMKLEAKIEQGIKIETGIKIEQDENRENYETMKMLGRVPELIQPIRDNPTSANGRVGVHNTASSVSNDLKPPEIIKPFETEPITRQQHLANGLDMMINREEGVKIEMDDSGVSSTLMCRSSQDYLSPMKSAQSISALLQEPLAPMPSLLQGIGDYHTQQTSQVQDTQHHGGRSYQYGDSLDSSIRENRQQNIAVSYPQSSQSIGTAVKIEKDVLCTVDISALAVPQQTIPETNPLASAQQTADPSQTLQNIVQMIPASTEDTIVPCLSAPTLTHATGMITTTNISTTTTTTARKSEHHKSDKKKKEKKHKHKEKDKPRDKRKHKHKDKDKEKEKHIKITIPKDKLNLTSETGTTTTTQLQISNLQATSEKKSPQAGLKIKIPKERLKVTESTSQTLVQAPLKIKIRTSGGSTVGENSETSVSVSTSSSRKRDRTGIEASGDGSLVAPPTKKQYPHHPQGATTTTTGQIQGITTSYPQQQSSQQGQRQNGRHYSSNNKEKHSSSHHKNLNKLSQQQQQQLVLQQQQQQQHHQQHSHAT